MNALRQKKPLAEIQQVAFVKRVVVNTELNPEPLLEKMLTIINTDTRTTDDAASNP